MFIPVQFRPPENNQFASKFESVIDDVSNGILWINAFGGREHVSIRNQEIGLIVWAYLNHGGEDMALRVADAVLAFSNNIPAFLILDEWLTSLALTAPSTRELYATRDRIMSHCIRIDCGWPQTKIVSYPMQQGNILPSQASHSISSPDRNDAIDMVENAVGDPVRFDSAGKSIDIVYAEGRFPDVASMQLPDGRVVTYLYRNRCDGS